MAIAMDLIVTAIARMTTKVMTPMDTIMAMIMMMMVQAMTITTVVYKWAF